MDNKTCFSLQQAPVIACKQRYS